MSPDGDSGYYDHPRPEVVALVPAGARYVVDVGCASGALGRALKASRPGIEVRGIEPVEGPAQRARARLDDVLQAGADAALPGSWPRPDCVIFADVLEHLADPWTVLKVWHDRLTPGGVILISLPNIAHHSVVSGLLAGRFSYQDAGILDRTHLRFFTRRTALELVAHAGLRVRHFGRVTSGADRSLPLRAARRIAERIGARGVGTYAADLLTVQFLLVGERSA